MDRSKPVRGSGITPDHIMLSFYGDSRTSMAVTWRNSADITNGYVEYWADGSQEKKTVFAQTRIFETDIDISSLFWAHLENLAPGTTYRYTCGHEGQRSAVFSFTTQKENCDKFKFICVSDQQSGEPFDCPDYSGFNRFIKQVLKDNPDTAFILTGGDNTDCGQHEQQWNGAFSGFAGISESVPVMMSVGNHDNRGFKDYKNQIGRYYAEPAAYFDKQFYGSYPLNGPEDWLTENYAFDYGNVHFNILGVNGPEQVRDWVLQDLKSCQKTWKFGVYHFPICYSGVDCQNYDAYPVMREAFECFDLVFSGHEHNFSRSFPLKNESLFDHPSQGTVHYMLGNSNRNPPGSRTLSKVWHAAFFPHEQWLSMAAVVQVDGNKVTLTSILEDGRIVDQCIIDKEKDVILPYALAPVYNRTRLLFKGMDPGLCMADTLCEQKGGIWFGCLATLVSYIGGYVQKSENKLEAELYGHRLAVTQGSAVAQTDRGELVLPAPVYRGKREQLYIPLDAVHAFDMRWAYAQRNNFISVEHESESKPVTVQP